MTSSISFHSAQLLKPMQASCSRHPVHLRQLTWLKRFSAAGSTDINSALKKAAGGIDTERPTYLIFLTDGLPTEGITDTQQIIQNFNARFPEKPAFLQFWSGI